MANPHTTRLPHDDLGAEIDRLMRQLPGADPHLKGDPAPAQKAASPLSTTATHERPAHAPAPRRSGAVAGAFAAAYASKSPARDRSALKQQLYIWSRAALVAALGLALTRWPYARDCSWSLYLYLGVVGTLLVSGGWAGVSAWRGRAAAAHVMSLVAIFWGIVLAAEQLLPRIGYAAVSAGWSCQL